jgi:hypothetical protein
MRLLKNKILFMLLAAVFSLGIFFVAAPKAHAQPTMKIPVTTFADACAPHSFFGLVPWYGYLKIYQDPTLPDVCHIEFNLAGKGGQFSKDGCAGTGCTALGGILLIGMAVFEDLLRVAGLVAVGLVIYGGVRYITSQGDPDSTKGAQATITNALIGLVIAVMAATTISFIANKLGG